METHTDMSQKWKTLSSILHQNRLRLGLFATLFLTLSITVPCVIHTALGAQPLAFDRRWLSPHLWISCAALLTLYYSCDGLRLFFTLKALGYRVALRHLGPLVFINILVSNLTPMATGGGLAQIWYLRRYGVHIGAATAATTLRSLQAIGFIFLPTPFLLLTLAPLKNGPLGERLPLYLALFAVLYLGVFAVILLRMRWIMALVDAFLALPARLRLVREERIRHWHFRARREMVRFSRAVRSFFRKPRTDAMLALVFTALFLLALFSFPALLLQSLGYSIDYPTCLGLLIVTTFVMYFSPTPGAAGIAEGVFGLFFAGLVLPGDLLLTILAWRFLTIHLGMLIGIPVTLRALLKR